MSRTEREVDVDLLQSWKQATANPDPIPALRASRELNHRLPNWQAVLVAEALAAGATWEEVGEALGATRQAAWSRFKTHIGSVADGGKRMNESVARARDEGRQELDTLYAQLRRRDQDSADEKRRLQGEIWGLRDQLRALDLKRAADKQALNEQIRERKTAFRERLHSLRSELRPPDTS